MSKGEIPAPTIESQAMHQVVHENLARIFIHLLALEVAYKLQGIACESLQDFRANLTCEVCHTLAELIPAPGTRSQ